MELTQFIDGFDLTSYEKEVILFLASINNANANTIYKNTKVPQGRIYSVLTSLIEKGFVKTIPSHPKRYMIDDIKESLQNYLERKRETIIRDIEKVESLEVKPKLFHLDKNAPSVYTFSGREEHLTALMSLRNQARNGLLQIAPLFDGTFASNRSIYNALKRGVRLKVIVRNITSSNKKNIKECLKLGAAVRCLDSPDLNYFLIRDGEEFILGLEDYKNKEERLSLYSKNKGLLTVLKNYFDKLWKEAKPVKIL